MDWRKALEAHFFSSYHSRDSGVARIAKVKGLWAARVPMGAGDRRTALEPLKTQDQLGEGLNSQFHPKNDRQFLGPTNNGIQDSAYADRKLRRTFNVGKNLAPPLFEGISSL